MKKFVRFAGVALLALTIGVLGCGDDADPVAPTVTVTVPTPPTPPTPTPPPLVVTMTPPSADVAVGSNVVFAVNASGGAAGATASWTCASSDTTFATASMATTGCQATGVAPGGVTITAAVTKGSETGNAGSQLTVMGPQVGDQAFILLHSIKWGEQNENTETVGLKGRVAVQANVERGDQVLEVVTLLVDGDSVAATSFGVVAEPAVEEPAAQAIHSFTLSFDTDDYDLSTGSPAYMNGDHVISMQLKVAGSEPIRSNQLAVDFDNDDGVYVTVSGLGTGALNSGTGQRWYGGPAAAVEITAVPVMYSGGSAASVGIVEFCGDEPAAATGPFVFTPECEGTGDHTAMFTADGAEIGVLNSDVFPLYLDYDGPSAPIFSPNPNNREDGWVNLTVDFGGEQGSRNKDGWLTFNDEDDSGVGGYQPVLRYAEGGDIEDARAAAPLSLANLPGESDENAYCVVASAVDLLGNESSLPGKIDDGACLIAGTPDTDDSDMNNDGTGYQMLLEELRVANAMMDEAEGKAAIETAMDKLADAGLLVGVDITPPGIEIEADDRFAAEPDAFNFDIFDDENEDHNSGLHSMPLLASAQKRDTDGTDCLDIDATNGNVAAGAAGMDCDDPTALEDVANDFTSPTDAYYTLWGTTRDKAGNHSETVSHTFVVDQDPATATALAAPGSIDAGEVFQIASFLNDNLSLRDYYVTANFAGGIELGFVHPTAVDAFDADPLTYRNQTITVDVETYAGVTTDPGTPAIALEGVTVAVRDQAQQGETPHTEVTGTFDVGDPAAADNFVNDFMAELKTIDPICALDDVGDCEMANRESEAELEFVATADAVGSFSEPFDRVDFWMQDVNGASWLIGSDASGTSGRVSSTDRTRTWTYSLDVSAARLYMLTREAGFRGAGTDDTHTVRAFGVNDDNVAVTDNEDVTIDDGES